MAKTPGLLLITILSVVTLTLVDARLAYVLNENVVIASPTIISLGSDSFFDEASLYRFEPLPLSYEDSDGGEVRKWIVHRVTDTKRYSTTHERSRYLQEEAITEDTTETDNSKYFSQIINAALSLLCVATAALAAGLTMGLLSLDPLTLEIKRRASPSQEERQWSEDLLPLLVGHSKRHRLLVSLLLMNSIANEALPLFLDELLPNQITCILVSVTLVLFFGEIVPSAFFTGPDQVKVAAKLVPGVKVVMFLLTPLAVPIASLLDRVLHERGDGDAGAHSGGIQHEDMEEEDVTGGNFYNRGELSALVRIQYEAQLAAKRKSKMVNQNLLLGEIPEIVSQPSDISSSSKSKRSVHTHNQIRSITRDLAHQSAPGNSIKQVQQMPSIHGDEITMIEGALAMTTKVAADVCTPLRSVYALPSDTVLDEDCVVEIWSKGFSRIPVYSPFNGTNKPETGSRRTTLFDESESSGIMGVLLTRQLIVLNPQESRPITTLPLATPPCIAPSVHLVDLINLFQEGGGRGKPGLHLALVCARPHIATSALEKGEPVPKGAGVIGIVTLEDVVEELLQEEIYDEYDRDLELAKWGVNKWKKFVRRKKGMMTPADSPTKKDSETGAHFDSALVRKVVIASEMNTETTPLIG